jgi:signal transduction histidine kinase
VLLVEDSNADARLLERALARGGFQVISERVDNRTAMRQALATQAWDLVLADHAMPQFSAPEALGVLQAAKIDIPFIIVSGFIEEATAVAAMRAGAHDYVMKDHLPRLVPAVERELREAAVRRARESDADELRRAREELEIRVQERTCDLRTANEKLQKLLEERRRLENEILEIAQNERRSIAFDLHDDLGQKLTGASLMLKGLEQRLARDGHPASADAQKLQELVNNIIHHTHTLAQQFSSLQFQGDLQTVLGELAENVRKMFEVSCTVTVRGEIPALTSNVLLQLQKIAQEALSNAVKHGKAKHISVTVTVQPGNLLLAIRNDGLPFAVPPSANKRMGLRIMRYRANTIGAEIDIQSQEKGGTCLRCNLQLESGSHSPAIHRNVKVQELVPDRHPQDAKR